MKLTLKPKKVVVILGTIITCLILANLGGLVSTHYLGHDYLFGLVPLFDLDQERNIPTLYSSIAILLCSALLTVIAVARKRKGQQDHPYWIGLAAVFLFLSIDESLSFHERLSIPIKTALNTSGFLVSAWVIPYTFFVIILLLSYLRFLLNLPRKIRYLMSIAGIIYIAGAIGFEMIGGFYWELNNYQKDFTFGLIACCEESLEMIGILIFAYSLMSHIDSEFGSLYIRISSSMENGRPSDSPR